MALVRPKASSKRRSPWTHSQPQKKSLASDHSASIVSDADGPFAAASLQGIALDRNSACYGLAVEARTRGGKSVLSIEQAIQEAIDEAL